MHIEKNTRGARNGDSSHRCRPPQPQVCALCAKRRNPDQILVSHFMKGPPIPGRCRDERGANCKEKQKTCLHLGVGPLRHIQSRLMPHMKTKGAHPRSNRLLKPIRALSSKSCPSSYATLRKPLDPSHQVQHLSSDGSHHPQGAGMGSLQAPHQSLLGQSVFPRVARRKCQSRA